MKKLNFLFIAIMAMAISFTSCKDDSEEIAAPVITIDQASPFALTSADALFTGQIVADGELAEVRFFIDGTQKGDAVTDFTDKTKYDIRYTVVAPGADFVFKVEAKDKNDKVSYKEIDVTVGSAGSLKSHDISLGDQNSTTGSFAASFEGTVYTASNAQANAASIDMVFYQGASNGSTIFSPMQAVADGITSFGSLGSWSVKNDSKFVKAAAADFSDADYASVETLASSASSGKANQLANGDVYGFKTLNGKHGVFKVTALGSNGITISVKIQDAAGTK